MSESRGERKKHRFLPPEDRVKIKTGKRSATLQIATSDTKTSENSLHLNCCPKRHRISLQLSGATSKILWAEAVELEEIFIAMFVDLGHYWTRTPMIESIPKSSATVYKRQSRPKPVWESRSLRACMKGLPDGHADKWWT